MKKLFFAALLLISFASMGQVTYQNPQPSLKGIRYQRVKSDSVQPIPRRLLTAIDQDTTPHLFVFADTLYQRVNGVTTKVGAYAFDTAAMLSNRLKISDTAIMLTGYKTYYPRTALSFAAGSGAYNASTGVITIPTNTNQLANTTYLPYSGGTMTGNLILNADPTTAFGAATKNYVDNVSAGLFWKPAAKAATTVNITLSGTQTVDGVALIAGDTVLVKNQTTAIDNGYYIVAAGAWTRASWGTTGYQLWGSAVFVKNGGTVNGGTQWTNSNSTQPTVGTDAITFAQIAGAGVYTNGTYLSLTGNVFDVSSTYAGQWNTAYNRSGTGLTFTPSTFTFTKQDATTLTAAVPTFNQNTTGTASNITGVVAIANGGTGQTTANAAFNALSPMTTAGDIIYGGTSGVGTRLAAGTATQVLHGGTVPSWSAVSLTADVSGLLPNANLANSSINFTAGSGITLSSASATLGSTALTITNSGVTSITGTANQITASASTGGVTLSIPTAFIAPGYIQATSNLIAKQNTNSATGVALYLKRDTDTGPLGYIIQAQNAAATANLFIVDVNGAVSGASYTGNLVNALTFGAGLNAGTFNNSAASTVSIATGGVTNAMLANSTISGVALGGTLASLTPGTHLSGGAYNGSGAVTIATDATNLNTASTIVARDASGNFSAGTITGNLSGNATTATALATGRTIAITGDLAYTSPSFDGSGNITAAGTLASVITAGGPIGSASVVPVITYDAKGRLTAVTSATIVAGSTAGTLTLGTDLSGTSYNGSANVTVNNTSTLATVTGRGASTATGISLSENGNLAASYALYLKRNTDTSPLGYLIQAQNTAATINLFTVDVNGTINASNFTGTSSGTNTGDQTITLTGNVTGSGTGSFATTIAAGVVTTAMMASANISQWTNNSGYLTSSTGVTTFSTGTTGLTPAAATSGAITLAGTLAIANGGTGSTTAQGAINTLAGAVTSAQYLRGNGTNVVMSAIQVSDVPTLNQNTTGTASNVTGIVAVANGGTGSGTQNFVDLTTTQTIAGVKTFSALINSTASNEFITNTSSTTGSSTIRIANTGANLYFGINNSAGGNIVATSPNATYILNRTATDIVFITNEIARQTINGTTGATNFSSTISASNLSGTNTGDQTITLTGNVTGSGTGSFATTIAAGVVTTAMMASANISQWTNNSGYLTSSTGVTTFSGGTTGLTPTAATSGAITLAGTLAVGNGGTGSSTQNFVDLTTAQTVAGAKTWSNAATFNSTISAIGSVSSAGGLWQQNQLTQYVSAGGSNVAWAWQLSDLASGDMSLSSGTTATGGTFTRRMNITNAGAATFSSSVTASSLIKSGGTSSQFLKADGSVDANDYLLTSSINQGTTNYVAKYAASLTIVNSQIFDNGTNVTINKGTPTANTRFQIRGASAYTSNTNFTLTTEDANGILGFVVDDAGNISSKGVSANYTAVTAAYTILSYDYMVVATGGSNYTITLPTAVGILGKIYIIKNNGATNPTLGTTSSQTIDGATTKSLATTYSTYMVQSDGANWNVITFF